MCIVWVTTPNSPPLSLLRDPPILGTTQHICDEDVRRLRGRSEGSADSKLIFFSVFLSLSCVENGS